MAGARAETDGGATPEGVAQGPGIAAVAVVVALVAGWVYTAPIAGARDGDFVHLWLGGRTLLEHGGARLYDPTTQLDVLSAAFPSGVPAELWPARNQQLGAFFYPPPAAVAYAAIAWLPLHSAATLHAVVAVCGGVLAGLLMSATLGGRPSRLWSVALILAAPAFFHNHVLGQNGIWALVLLLASALALRRDRELLAGLCLGLLVLKPSWLLAAGWIPVVLGRWRAVGATLGAALAVCALSAGVAGAEGWAAWTELAPQIASLADQPNYPLHLQYSAPAMGRRLFGPGGAAQTMTWVLSVSAGLAAVLGMRRSWASSPSLSLGLGLVTAVLVNPHVHPYDLLPAVVGGAALWSAAASPIHRWLGGILLLALWGAHAAEGLTGSGLTVAPVTVVLGLTWGTLLYRALRAPVS